MPGKNKRLLFIFPCPWEHEIVAVQAGEKPTHRLFAYQELIKAGYQVDFTPCPRWLLSTVNKNAHLWTVYSNFIAALTAWRYQEIIGVQENAIWFLLFLKRLHLVASRVTVTNVALLKDENLTGKRYKAWKYFLGRADHVVSYSSEQVREIAERFGIDKSRNHYISYGVDTEFFDLVLQRYGYEVFRFDLDPTNPPPATFHIIAAGSAGRDYETLIAAVAGLDGVELGIYCMPDVIERLRRTVPNLPENARLHLGNLSYKDLAQLYREADCVVIPLHDKLYSAGQTVILEAMACGSPLITSNVIGTRDYVEDGVSGLLVSAENHEALREKIIALKNDPALQTRLGAAAKERVYSHFGVKPFAQALEAIIK